MNMESNTITSENNKTKKLYTTTTSATSINSENESGEVVKVKTTRWNRFKDSFREYRPVETDNDPENGEPKEPESPLSRNLKNRHVQMMAMASCIGTGLFVGAGPALRDGGPLAMILGWSIIGSALYCTIQSLGEMCVVFPLPGAFTALTTKFVDPSWGFAVGWNYAIQWLVVLPLELVAAAITIKFWNDTINSAAFVVIFYVIILLINLFGSKGYGEAEFVFSIIKIVTVVAFFIMSIFFICGKGPSKEDIGVKYWKDPGYLSNGFKGVCSVFITAGFSYNGTELVGMTAAETLNPKKSLPAATKQVLWRILFFYIVSLTLVGFLVPYNEPRLMSSGSETSASPFVLAIKNASVKGLPSVMNVVIMIAVLSVGNSSVFACSRTLQSLSSMGMAPKFLNYIDRSGRPLRGILVSLFVGLLCFLAATPKQSEIFAWMMSIAGLSGIIAWISIGVCHLRFRAALKAQKQKVEELPFVAMTGIWGTWYSIIVFVFILVVQCWIAIDPIGSKPNAANFFKAYLTVPFALSFYITHKIYTKSWRVFIPASEIDLITGRKVFDLEILNKEIEEDKAHIKARPFYYKIYRKLWA